MTAEEIAGKYTWHIIINRWGAAWLDLIILFLIFLIPNFILGDHAYRNTSGIWISIACLYFPVLEGYLGWTVGKLVSGIRVVDNEIKPPGFLKALIRTAFRLFEVNPFLFGGIIAGIFVRYSMYRQRLGDIVAKTYVVTVLDFQEAKKNQNKFGSLLKKIKEQGFPDKEIAISLDAFFKGNDFIGSIGANLDPQLTPEYFYEILKTVSSSNKTENIFVRVSDVIDTDWFYTDTVYIIGDWTVDELRKILTDIRPDEIYEYWLYGKPPNAPETTKKIFSVWWD